MSESLHYGPVLVTKGEYKGHIGYYDDDENGKVFIYPNIPLFCSHYYMTNYKNVTSTIPTEKLAKRWQELDNILYAHNCGRTSTLTDSDIVDVLLERALCVDLLNERFFYSMQKMQSKQEHKVFISHSSKDAVIARCIATDLLDAGYSVFLDDWSINVGDRIFEKINNGLENSTAFIMIISKDYMSSVCCKDEWSAFYNKALHNKKCRIYPLIIDDSNPPTLLSPIKYLRVSDEAFPEILHQLLGTLKRQFEQQSDYENYQAKTKPSATKP